MRNRTKPTKPATRFYTPDRTRQRVIGRRIAGQTIHSIAKAEQIHHETVLRILSSEEAQEMMAVARSTMQESFPKLAKKMVALGLSGDRQAITDIFKGLQVFQSRDHLEHTHLDLESRSDDELRYFLKHDCWPEDKPPASAKG